MKTYFASENCVYYGYQGHRDAWELFLTVHPMKDELKTTQQQAATLASLLNNDASLRYRVTERQN